MKEPRAPHPEGDEEARRRAADDLDRNYFIEAGAGTGKTRLLVERIINIVRRGRARLTEVAAITFTEKAAAELLSRVREGLEKARAEPTGDPAEGQRLAEAMTDLARAPISTIHGLAGQILRERPVEAGIDPYFKPLDGVAASFAREEAWERWLPGALDRDPRPARRALRAGVSLKGMRELAQFLLEHRDRARPEAFAPPEAPDLEGFLDLAREHQGRLQALAPACKDPEDGALVQIAPLGKRLLEARERLARGDAERAETMLRALRIDKRGGNTKHWNPAGACTRAKALLREIEEARAVLVGLLDHDVLAGLGVWLLDFVRFTAAEFRARGWLTFQDYLIECRDLLRDRRDARAHFQERFRAILLDEFQDTDPLQVEIAFYLAEEEPRASSWGDVRLAPGKLFIVGDPKQSIYRFRRADIELYEEVRTHIDASGGEVLNIRRNHRSVPGVIDWVNSTFAALIRKPADGSYQPEYVPLLPHRPAAAGPAVLDLAAGADLKATSAAKARREEGARLGDLILMLRSRGYRFRDLGVLFPRSSGIEFHEEALLARGIPYHLEGGKEFFAREEVAGVLNALEALDQPEDAIALVGALKSSLFGHGDAELVGLLAEGGRLSYLEEPPAAFAGPLPGSLRLLRALHEERNRLPMAAVVGRLVDGTGAAAAAVLRARGGLPASQNLKKLLALARRFDAEGLAGATFGRFARWLRRMWKDGAEEAESPAFEEQADVVRLLSIHKAKGLQFKAAILVNLGSDDQFREKFIWSRDRLEVRFSSDDGPATLGFEEAKEREVRRLGAERCRLLYVAATRAEDLLVISRIAAAKDTETSDLGRLRDHRAPERVEPPRAPEEKAARQPDEAFSRRIRQSLREVASRAERVRAGYRPPRIVRPSEQVEALPAEAAAPAAAGDREAAFAFGTAVHRVLELADLDADEAALFPLAELVASEEGVPERAGEVLAHVRRALGSPVLARARRSSLRRREARFQLDLAGPGGLEGFVSGSIDLFFEEEGSLVIVDYKTDRVQSPGEARERARCYEPEVREYARALEKLTGRPVRETVLVFTALQGEGTVRIEVS